MDFNVSLEIAIAGFIGWLLLYGFVAEMFYEGVMDFIEDRDYYDLKLTVAFFFGLVMLSIMINYVFFKRILPLL